ncbi:MAG TPA: patatin-like phospholipase family protein [Rubrivivax sp.]|nr:patatin-like phospholipase family protein [Rubrivivax sp.]
MTSKHWLGCAWTLAAVAAGAQRAQAPALPASAPALQHPRICLVLSGGGARGAAHVGVLKVLEELRVPVHCIAGTSMGSIVGASYASGMGTQQMLDEMAKISSERLFGDKPPRGDEPMRVKSNDWQPLAAPELGVNDGKLSTPKGVVTGVALEAELRRLVKVHDARPFDQLPIPFRAVATSLGDGRMVVLDHGLLPTAMRASMAVPALVAPLKLDDRLLIDGGLVRNLPVDVARAMGADVVIAVNLGTPLLKPEQIEGLQSVAMQTLGILTEQNVRESLQQLRPADVLIEPALGDFSAADFDQLLKTVPIGEAAARAVAPRLRELALPEREYAALRAGQQIDADPPPVVLAGVEVAGQRRVNPEFVLQNMQTQAGQPLDEDQLDLDMRRIYGTGEFESVRPTLTSVDGQTTLVVNVTEKGWGPQYLRAGLSLSSDLGETAYFNFHAQLRSTWLNPLGAEWRNDLVLGRDLVWATRWHQPLTPRQQLFVEPRLVLSDTPLYIYTGDVLLSEYREGRYGAGVDFGLNFRQYGQLRLGLYRAKNRLDLRVGPVFVMPQGVSDNEGGVLASLRMDQLDHVSFARSGYLLWLEAQSSQTALGASTSYTRVAGELRTALSYGEHTLQLSARGGTSSDGDALPIYAMFKLGGFLDMSGYRYQQLLGYRYAYARALYQTRLARVPLFEGVYGGLAYEIADMPQLIALNDQRLFQSGTAYLAADTPLGVAYFGLGYANKDNVAVYLQLGKPF